MVKGVISLFFFSDKKYRFMALKILDIVSLDL
jgi:hypothetical protein